MTKCKTVTVSKYVLKMAKDVHANRHLLPNYFPNTPSIHKRGRFMEDYNTVGLLLAAYSGEMTEGALHDLHCLNHYLISRYGTKLPSTN